MNEVMETRPPVAAAGSRQRRRAAVAETVPGQAVNQAASLSDEQRELLRFDALRVGLGYVHGLEREQLCKSLRAAGMVVHRADDECEAWHWPQEIPTARCQHGLSFCVESGS